MSDLSERVRGFVLLADFVNNDAAGKVNVVGGGLSLIGFDPATGQSAPFAVLAHLTCAIPGTETAAVELLLADSSGNVVMLPTPTGESQAMRVAQNVQFQPPVAPGVVLPAGALGATAQIIMHFLAGLPLRLGESYTWRLQVDHEPVASTSFFIPGPPQGPVIG